MTCDDGTIHGTINGHDINLTVFIRTEYHFFSCLINGEIKKMSKNGKTLTYRWECYNPLAFKVGSYYKKDFKYEEVKPLLIDKIIKKILITVSKRGILNLK